MIFQRYKHEKYIIYLYLKFVALYSGLHVSRIGFLFAISISLYFYILY